MEAFEARRMLAVHAKAADTYARMLTADVRNAIQMLQAAPGVYENSDVITVLRRGIELAGKEYHNIVRKG